MRTEHRRTRMIVRLLAVIWLAFWFWTFSFAYGNSFFAYDLPSRLPPFVAALAGAAVIFAGWLWQWRSKRTIWRACLWQLCAVVAALLPLVLVSAALIHAPAPWRPSGDDSLGLGIDFAMLAAAGLASVAVLAIALAWRHWWRGREQPAAPQPANRGGAQR